MTLLSLNKIVWNGELKMISQKKIIRINSLVNEPKINTLPNKNTSKIHTSAISSKE